MGVLRQDMRAKGEVLEAARRRQGVLAAYVARLTGELAEQEVGAGG